MKKIQLNAPAAFAIAVIGALTLTTMRPTLAVQAFAIVACASSTACTGGSNSSTGPGVQGISARGQGVVGQTKFNSTSSTNGQAGVLGQDLSTSGLSDWGVRGTSVRGRGVQGSSISNAGVWGNSGSGSGVRGASSTSNGVFGQTSGANAFGVMGSTQFGKAGVNGTTALSGIAGVSGVANNDGVAVMGVANNVETNPAAIFGVDHGGFSSGVMGTADNSMGVIGTTTSGAEAGVDGEVSASGAVAVLANSFAGTGAILRTYQASSPGLLVQNAANGGAGDPILVAANPNKDVMSVDEAGNLIVSGSVTAHGTPLLVRQSAFGQPVVSYAASTTSPVIEDFGHAQLAYGTAYVSIDRGFAAAVDPRGSFAVFITPNGESRGLYVTGKSLNGFYVRENSGGRSSVGFDYRIVARPNGEKPLRLPSALGMPLVTPGAGRALQLRDLIARENQRFARLQKELNAARAQALELANASKAALAREEKEYPR